MQEQEQNRTEQATPFKLSEARKQGQVARSLDFNVLAAIWGLFAALAIFGGPTWERFCELSAMLLVNAGDLHLSGQLAQIIVEVMSLITPFLGIGIVVAVVANLVQTGPVFSVTPLKPKFDRLNPIAGFKRIYNKRMLFELVKNLFKLALFVAITYGFFRALWPALSALSTMDVRVQLAWLGDNGIALLVRLGMALLLVGLLDWLFVRWQFSQQMMMSRREVKEEIKRREGDPLIRAKLRELQRENLKQSGSVRRVPQADALITNPQHFAVALRYVRGQMHAPHIIAKGRDAWVGEMKSLARQHGVPIIESRALARRLFRRAVLDHPIPEDTFVDVARIYADLGRRSPPRQHCEALI